MDYSKLQDRQVDAIIAKKRYGMRSDLDIQRLFSRGKFDFCNNPSDAWPIILDAGIELSPMFGGDWCASHIDSYTFEEAPIYNVQAVHKNPLRAAMIVYLSLLTQAKGKSE